jgi:hypothetical protein
LHPAARRSHDRVEGGEGIIALGPRFAGSKVIPLDAERPVEDLAVAHAAPDEMRRERLWVEVVGHRLAFGAGFDVSAHHGFQRLTALAGQGFDNPGLQATP